MSRISDFSLKGKKFHVNPSFLEQYPFLKLSRFWVDRSEHVFLAWLFADQRDVLGATFEGRRYGMAWSRCHLSLFLGPGDFWDLLLLLLDPMNGQQKNFLLSLSTVVQTAYSVAQPVSVDVNVEQEESLSPVIPIEVEDAGAVVPDLVHMPSESGSVEHVLFSKLARHLPRQYSYTKKIAYSVDKYLKIRRGESVIEWEVYDFLRQLKKTFMFPRLLYDPCKSCFRVYRYLEGYSEHVEISDKNVNITILGSKMGERSGVWHDPFVRLLSDYGYGGTVKFVDYFESVVTEVIGSFAVQHKKPGEDDIPTSSSSILVHDAQTSDVVPDVDGLPPSYSLKKKGKDYFNFEHRSFSHSFPLWFRNLYTPCQCLRCCTVSFIATPLGGYPAFLRVQAELSRFGDVCIKERIEMYRSRIYAESSNISMSYPLSSVGLEAAHHLSMNVENGILVLPQYDPCLSSLKNKRVGIYAYYENSSLPHRFNRPYDAILTDNISFCIEVGCPPEVWSKDLMVVPGYQMRETKGNWRVFVKKKPNLRAYGLEIKM